MIGQLSEFFYRGLAQDYHVFLDLIFCVVPDLSPLGFIGGRYAQLPGNLIFVISLQATIYCAFILILSTWCYSRYVSKKPIR